MINLVKYAGMRGETPLEFFNYAWTRTHENQRCANGTTLKDAANSYSHPFHMPDYVAEWFKKRELRLNNHPQWEEQPP